MTSTALTVVNPSRPLSKRQIIATALARAHQQEAVIDDGLVKPAGGGARARILQAERRAAQRRLVETELAALAQEERKLAERRRLAIRELDRLKDREADGISDADRKRARHFHAHAWLEQYHLCCSLSDFLVWRARHVLMREGRGSSPQTTAAAQSTRSEARRDAETAGRLLAEHVSRTPFNEIVEQECADAEVTVSEFMSDRRHRRIVRVRHRVWWRAGRETLLSLPQMGRLSGGRDHTTVLHGQRKQQARVDKGEW